MTRRVKRIAPLQAGKISGVLYGLVSLIFIPFFLLAAVAGAFANSGETNAGVAGIAAGGMILMAILLPIIYALFGFVGGVICAAIYNVIAQWVGGIEVELEDVPAHGPPAPVVPA